MKPEDNTLRFFLGANTPQGFVSRFDQLAEIDDGWRILALKGGPGCGKSTLMRRIARELGENDAGTEVIHCSSDAGSIDGVILPHHKIAVADGTPPHPIEPRFPGAYESTVDITPCWDEKKLYDSRDRIIALITEQSRCHEHCCRFLSAAGSLSGDSYRIALSCVNTAKLSGYCARLADKELKPVKSSPGKERVRFLSAVTNQGIIRFTNTAKLLCERIYLINDEHGAISRLLLQSLRGTALAGGHDVISCYCPLHPFDKLEHLFIPALGLGFMTSNHFHNYSEEIEPYRIVNSQRFTDNKQLSEGKKRILFNRKAATQMIRQAGTLIEDAKRFHDELESYYIHAMDFSKLDALADDLLARIKSYR